MTQCHFPPFARARLALWAIGNPNAAKRPATGNPRATKQRAIGNPEAAKRPAIGNPEAAKWPAIGIAINLRKFT